jgi:uncharacterized low-complexity protein
MRSFKLALATAFVAVGLFSVGSVGTAGIALAKDKAPKAAPGKCGAGKFFDKKTKKCASK